MFVLSTRLLLSACALALAACHNLPVSTRNGDTKEIVISERSIIGVVQVHPDEEMRWTNRQSGVIRITVLDYVLNNLSCRRNFSGHYYSGAEASLVPNESASLCFSGPGIIRYSVTSQGIFQTGEVNVGQIHSEASHKDELSPEQERATPLTRTVYTAWCEDETTTQEQCL